MKALLEKAEESKATTGAGIVTSLGAIVLALIPADTWEACTSSIAATGNPLLVGGLLIVGIGLTFIGPSFTKKSSSK